MFRRAALLAGVACAILAVACNGDETAEQPHAATVRPWFPEMAVDSQRTEYPLTVTDMLGREVTIDARPSRIVTTSTGGLELLDALGVQAVGRSSNAAHLPIASGLADVGPHYAPSLSRIAELRPHLVLADAASQARLRESLEEIPGDVPVVFVGGQEYGDLARSLWLLGEVLDRPHEAAAAAWAVDAAQAEVQASVEGLEPTRAAVIAESRDGTLLIALPTSFAGDLLRLAGAANVGAGREEPGRGATWARVSLEELSVLAPDVVFVVTAGEGSAGSTLTAALRERFPRLPAVRDDRLYEIEVELYMQSPSPRAADELRALAALLHPSKAAAE